MVAIVFMWVILHHVLSSCQEQTLRRIVGDRESSGTEIERKRLLGGNAGDRERECVGVGVCGCGESWGQGKRVLSASASVSVSVSIKQLKNDPDSDTDPDPELRKCWGQRK
jgi:hypothetical protein